MLVLCVWGRREPPLKLTAKSPLKMDGCNTFSFPFGAQPIFMGELLVSGRGFLTPDICLSKKSLYF